MYDIYLSFQFATLWPNKIQTDGKKRRPLQEEQRVEKDETFEEQCVGSNPLQDAGNKMGKDLQEVYL